MNYLYHVIEAIRERPAVYIGRISLTALYDYLGGFQSAMYIFGKSSFEKLFPLPFGFFNDYVANHYNWYESTLGWRNIILKETIFDDEKGFWIFYELFDSFKLLSIQQCCIATLNKNNINYHYTDKFAPKRLLPPDYNKTEPLYINPIEAYMIELTHNAGYLCMINTDSQHRLECRIYKDKLEFETFIKQCFGFPIDWQCIETDNIEFCKELQY